MKQINTHTHYFTLTTLATLMLAAPCWATSGGTDVPEEDYVNTLVQIKTDEGTCGATLIAGNWLLTAKHCTPLYDTDDLTTTGTIRIWQGVEMRKTDDRVYYGDATFYSGLTEEDQELLLEDRYYNENIAEAVESLRYTYDPNDNGYDKFNPYLFGKSLDDVALVKLESSIAYTTTYKVAETYGEFATSYDSWADLNAVNAYPEGTSLTFRGWGTAGNSGEDDPDVMQAITVNVTQPSVLLDCTLRYWNAEEGTITKASDCDDHSLEDDDAYSSSTTTLYVHMTNYLKTDGDASNEAAQSGDSGTGLIDENNTIVGLLTSTGNYTDTDNYTNSFSTVDAHYDWILETVNRLNVPDVVNYAEDDAGEYHPTYTLEVQNLSPSAVSVTPAFDDTTFFYVESSDCGSTLESGESCEVSIATNSTDFAAGDSATANLIWNTEYATSITFAVADDDTSDDDTSDTDSDSTTSGTSESSSSSGGSFGLFSVLSLGLLFFRKKY